jgi:hypothetical protein
LELRGIDLRGLRRGDTDMGSVGNRFRRSISVFAASALAALAWTLGGAGIANAFTSVNGADVGGSNPPVYPTDGGWNWLTRSGGEFHYYRIHIKARDIASYAPSGGDNQGCVVSQNIWNYQPAITAAYDHGLTLIFAFEWPSAGSPVPTTEFYSEECAAKYLAQDVAYFDGASENIYIEPDNEPDSPTGPETNFTPGDYATMFWSAVVGAGAGSYASYSHFLAGTFATPYAACNGSNCAPGNGGYADQVYNGLNSWGVLPYVSGWAVHDYNDPNTAKTLGTAPGSTGCYISGGSASSDCSWIGMSSFDSWAHAVNMHGGSNSIWLTETAGPVAGTPPGWGLSHNRWYDARAASDVEYLAYGWANVTLWYDWTGPNSGSWDSGVYNTSTPGERTAYCVLTGESTTASIGDYTNCPADN